jgi:hypothetical protein
MNHKYTHREVAYQMQSAEGPMMGCCEAGNEKSASIVCGELLDKLSKYHSFKNDCSTKLMKLE